MIMYTLEVKNLTKIFGEQKANDNVSLQIEQGEFFVLLGPSGCGKSTLLRSVAGLEIPDSGEIFISGESVMDKEPGERDVAMMFQQATLYPNMNVFDNVAFPLKIKGVDKQEIEEQVTNALELVQIPEKRDSNIKNLSGGEAQRAMIARVLVQDPEVFLLDEPFSSLDHQLRVYMRKEIMRIHQKTGVTIMFVTHNQEEAMKVGDQLAIMNNGRIEQVGTPAETLQQPNNKFVAQFIGHPQMNFIPAEASEEDGQLFLKVDSQTYGPISRDDLIKLPESMDLTIGVRPEEISVEKGKESEKGRLNSTVEFTESTGANNYIHFELGGASVQASVPEITDWEESDEVTVSFNDELLKLFDPDGERVK
jgi:ABC-type sugar transport system ATPase subunit